MSVDIEFAALGNTLIHIALRRRNHPATLQRKRVAETSYTKDEPFIVTLVTDEGERDRHLHYLLSDGERRRVTIDVSLDSPELRKNIGEGLAHRRYKRGRNQ